MTSSHQSLRDKGLKLTPQRTLILDIMGEADCHVMTADEILTRARSRQPQISASTVYRNLNLLCEAGLVRRLDSVEESCCYELQASHHHHLICLKCHRVEAIDGCPMSDEIIKAAGDRGFTILDHVFEIKGYCRQCADERR